MFRHALMLTALLAGTPFVHTAEGAAFASAAIAAAPMSEGKIRKIDTVAGKLTIKRSSLDSLGMESTAMVFRVQNPTMLDRVQVGNKVRFVAKKVNGALTVTALEIQ